MVCLPCDFPHGRLVARSHEAVFLTPSVKARLVLPLVVSPSKLEVFLNPDDFLMYLYPYEAECVEEDVAGHGSMPHIPGSIGPRDFSTSSEGRSQELQEFRPHKVVVRDGFIDEPAPMLSRAHLPSVLVPIVVDAVGWISNY